MLALPIIVLLGFAGARLIFPQIPPMTALLLAAALAPTDAGLGAATVFNPVVPVRIRRLLNLEGGLNDGLITPVVLFAIAGVAGGGPGTGLPGALVGPLAGALVGGIVGGMGGLVLGWSRAHDLSSPHTRSLGVLVIPILSFFLAEALGANGFVSAFVAGAAFTGGATWADSEDSALRLTESLSEPLAFAVWLVFGLAATPVLRSHVGWREALYAGLSLTAFRMVPIAVSLVGTRFRWQTVAFVAWFGPRGLPTVVFALIALESLEVTDSGRVVIATAALTVLLSVLAHGLTADVLAARYGAWVGRVRPSAELAAAIEPWARRSLLGRGQIPA